MDGNGYQSSGPVKVQKFSWCLAEDREPWACINVEPWYEPLMAQPTHNMTMTSARWRSEIPKDIPYHTLTTLLLARNL